MTEPIIWVENLGKKYLIRHQQKEPYTALRDVITNGVKSLGRTLVKGGGEKRENQSREEFWALKDVSFEINRGDRLGIIGRNGAGKSTLLKILSRITEPTTGRARIKGRVASLLEVGTGFHAELTGRENIYLNGSILGMSKLEISKRFDEIVAFAEVEKFLDTPVKRYSSGMYVRLAFAVAAHLDPEVLIVDEVLAVGDIQFQKKCLAKMENISQAKGRTVMFVSHNMTAIQDLCSSVVYLSSGQVIGQGSVEEQIEKYLSLNGNTTQINQCNSFRLSANLSIVRLICSPNPVVSGSELDIELGFYCSKPVQVYGLAMLVYSSLGVRVALLDLKQDASKYRIPASVDYVTQIKIDSFCLVEGSYQIGLYIHADEIRGDFLDILTIDVVHNHLSDTINPYPRDSRGLVEFDFRIS